MADLTYTQMKARLNVGLRDTDNFGFTDAEKDEALQQAYDDPYVFKISIDSSITAVPGQYVYPLTTFEWIIDIGYDGYGTGSPVHMPRSYWSYVDGTIYFSRDALDILSRGKILFVKGKRKFTIADLIPSYLTAYILLLARSVGLDLLMADKTQRFLRNDTTLSELQNAQTAAMQKAERLRKRLPNRASVRL